jgi:hypothetical protein
MVELTKARYRVDATWNDVPHLNETAKSDLLSSYPRLGVGAIYTTNWDVCSEQPFQIPPWFPRGYALDVGWNWTAAVWGAWDRENDCVHVVSEYKVPEERPVMHAAAIKARGEWQAGAIDPASRGRSQDDGKQLLMQYRQHGLNLVLADNAVEAGIFAVQERLETGRLKFFSNLRHLEREYHRYHREETEEGRSKIVKVDDHCLDALRYLIMGFKMFFTTRPVERKTERQVSIGDVRAGY